jgi:N-acetylmuramoyl-L-alanine amidase
MSGMRRSPARALLILLAAVAGAAVAAGLIVVMGAGGGSGRHPAPPRPSEGPTTATVAATPEVATPRVVIDPGHNGLNWAHTAEVNRLIPVPTGTKPCDTAGTTTRSGYTEAEYNLDVARRLAPVLSGQGTQVVLTRTDNGGWGPCIDERVAVANRISATAVVSIHADGWPRGRGFTVLYAAPRPGSPDVASPLALAHRRLAVDIRDAYLRGTGMPYATYAGAEGLQTVPWPTLYRVAEVIIETGNMRDPTDATLLENPAFRDRVAAALAAGIRAFLEGA